MAEVMAEVMNEEEEFISRHEVKEVVGPNCSIRFGLKPNAFGGLLHAQAQMCVINSCDLEVRVGGQVMLVRFREETGTGTNSGTLE